MKSIFIALSLVLLSTQPCFSEGSNPNLDFRKKAEAKKGSRWTLAEWLEQKERNQLMDLWLQMYSPSVYEFFVHISQNNYKHSTIPETTSNDYSSLQGGLGAFATVLGVRGDYENNAKEGYSEFSGSLNLRIAGNAVQGTHLIIYGGQRSREYVSETAVTKINQSFAGGDLNLYLNPNIGLAADYRKFLEKEDDNLGKVNGSLTKAGLFIDFEAFRIFGNWHQEVESRILNANETQIKREGIQSGIQFYF